MVISVGRLGETGFRAGAYAYVGSAAGGLRGRLRRHLRAEKRTRWHIDYLLERARIERVLTCYGDRSECAIARTLAARFEAVPGFGASDCRCRGHLFFSHAAMTATVRQDLAAAGLGPRLWRPEELMP